MAGTGTNGGSKWSVIIASVMAASVGMTSLANWWWGQEAERRISSATSNVRAQIRDLMDYRFSELERRLSTLEVRALSIEAEMRAADRDRGREGRQDLEDLEERVRRIENIVGRSAP